MSERSLSHAWLPSWVGKASGVLNAMTEEFERRHGFPPGTNQVRSANRDDQEAACVLVQVDVAAGDLVAFYECVGEVAWADVGNGYVAVAHPERTARLPADRPISPSRTAAA